MADKRVSVRVDLNASGNLQQVVGKSRQEIKQLFADMNKGASAGARMTAGMSGNGFFNNPLQQNVSQSRAAAPVSAMMAALSKANPNSQASSAMIAGMSAPSLAAKASAEAAEKARETQTKNIAALDQGFSKLVRATAAAESSLIGFALAAGPAVAQTLTGSFHLLAGEIGITVIPAVVELSRFLQRMATNVRNFDAATGGIVGQVAKAAVVPGAIIVLGGIAVRTGQYIFGLGGAAAEASVALRALAMSGAGAAGGQAVGGAVGGIGKFGRAVGIAGIGSFAANLAGNAVGGTAGGYLSAAGTGASIGAGIGSFVGPLGTAIGAALGAGIGLVVENISNKKSPDAKKAAFSMNFQGGSSSIEGMHELIQREAIKDPMQQETANQQMRATLALAQEIGFLSAAIHRNQPWMANQ